jgi:hypothetical protein
MAGSLGGLAGCLGKWSPFQAEAAVVALTGYAMAAFMGCAPVEAAEGGRRPQLCFILFSLACRLYVPVLTSGRLKKMFLAT